MYTMILLYQRIKGYEGIMGTSRSREFRGRMRRMRRTRSSSLGGKARDSEKDQEEQARGEGGREGGRG